MAKETITVEISKDSIIRKIMLRETPGKSDHRELLVEFLIPVGENVYKAFCAGIAIPTTKLDELITSLQSAKETLAWKPNGETETT